MSCLFDIVVIINLASVCGSLFVTESRRSDVVDVAGRGKDRVGGNPNPGNVVTKTLRFLFAIMFLQPFRLMEVRGWRDKGSLDRGF